MRYARYMTINVRCNWPHKINALFAINVVSIRTRNFLRSISLDFVPLRPNRRCGRLRALNLRAFSKLTVYLSKERSDNNGADLAKSRSVSVVFVYQLSRRSLPL